LVVQDFATIHSMKPTRYTMIVDSKLPICRWCAYSFPLKMAIKLGLKPNVCWKQIQK
jgi:hypothetical protein